VFRKKFDFYLILPVIFLLCFGVGTISSVSPANLSNHLIYIFISIIFFLIFSWVDLEMVFPFSPFIYLFSLGFLILPFILGTVTRGSVRWIPIGGYTIQPSEIIKPFLGVIAAWYWAKKDFTFKRFFYYCLLFLPVLLLIFFQPDLGSTLVVLSIFGGMILVSKIKFKQVLVLLLASVLILPLGLVVLKPYQRLRLIHFINPYSDPLGEGYNVIQAKIAVGSGGVSGKGLGHGTQSHLSFLPERHTDFIFASLAEELGFFGSALVLFFYFLFFLKILKIVAQCQDSTMGAVAFSIFFYLAFQTIVNIGMNMGLLPITGITLPFVSYGGSSLLASMMSLGILESISRRRAKEEVIEIR